MRLFAPVIGSAPAIDIVDRPTRTRREWGVTPSQAASSTDPQPQIGDAPWPRVQPEEMSLPSKTKGYDDSIALTGMNRGLLSAVCLQLQSRRDPAESLLQLTHRKYDAVLGEMVGSMQHEHLNVAAP